MIWTIVCFLITLFVLKRYAFGPIQKAIDERRERIRQSLDEADQAREEARKLLEEHRKLIGSAKTDAEEILAEARRVAEPNERGCATSSRPTASGGSRRRASRSRPRPAGARADPRRGRRSQLLAATKVTASRSTTPTTAA